MAYLLDENVPKKWERFHLACFVNKQARKF